MKVNEIVPCFGPSIEEIWAATPPPGTVVFFREGAERHDIKDGDVFRGQNVIVDDDLAEKLEAKKRENQERCDNMSSMEL